MKEFARRALALGLCATAATAAMAQQDGTHRMVLPSELKWADVPSLPPGAKIAVIEGPMNQPAPFTVRLKFPKDYVIPAHSHPAIERVTVLSGTFNMGAGDRFDKSRAHALPPGAIAIMQSGTNHFAWASDEVIVQLNGTGPWDVKYVNPEDDPRRK